MLKNNARLIIVFFCIVQLILHLIADSNSGFQSDELLHVQTGNHPAFGYMEFPPMIGWLAFIQNQFHSTSIFVHHIFTHLATVLIIILVGLITIELGGKNKALIIVLLCITVSPAFGRTQQLFQPVVFSQLSWVLCFYQLLRFVKTLNQKYLWYLALSLALGFLSKYDILFFIAGLAGLLIFERTRNELFTKHLWKYILVFILIISPNIYWQYTHQFPVFNMFSRLYQTQLNELSAGNVLKELIITLNPITAIFWIAGFLFMFNKKDKAFYRPIAFTILISLLVFALSKSKAYYFYSAFITLLIFGSIWFEQLTSIKRKWMMYPAIALLVLSGIFMMPFGLAIMPGNAFIKYAHIKKTDGHYEMKVDCQEYFSKQKWSNTLAALKQVYDSLPASEKTGCLIWGKHYSQAGAVELWRADYDLPKAFSYHGSFYLWAPSGPMPATVIAFTNDEAQIDFFQSYFDIVIPVKRVFNPYAMFDKDLYQTIYICKNPKQNFDELKQIFKTRVFE